MKKEKLQPNVLEATLFVGLGGCGSRIIRGVRERCINDDLENVRFVTMDTDVNDLERLENGPAMITVQTSSSRSVAAYLRHDTVAKNEWFPENKILDGKTVSEGAGQVRAISRLALNASIKQGKIAALYKAIDDLYLKNGSSHNRAVKIIIASTATGGTGSGITLPVAMMIRKYLKENYPESAAIIRGFIVMPGVLDTVITSESERKSQRRNGYATIKEINAFMMKASGACDYDPRLHRYSDLHMTVPSMGNGSERLSNLPFDFCFLLDRIDGNQRNMPKLRQYEDYAAQSIYEQCVGPMKESVNSKEDNIHKEFSDPQKHGRCRFGGAGASVIRYPYEEIRDYIALDWAQNSILGVASAKDLTDEERENMIERSWMIYDHKFAQAFKKWQSDPMASKEEPKLADFYLTQVESGSDDFTDRLKRKFLQAKIDGLRKGVEASGDDGDSFSMGMNAVAEEFFEEVSKRARNIVGSNLLLSEDDGITYKDKMDEFGASVAPKRGSYRKTYNYIKDLSNFMDHTGKIERLVEGFAKDLFESQDIIGRKLEPYRIGSYLSCGNHAMHPNAARYLLYKLLQYLKSVEKENKPYTRADFDKNLKAITDPESADKIKAFNVVLAGKSEKNLYDMCVACDTMKDTAEHFNPEAPTDCRKFLNAYYGEVLVGYTRQINATIIRILTDRVEKLCKTYERFYASFGTKASGIEKQRENIVGKLENDPGSSTYHLFGSKELLETLARRVNPGKSDDGNNELFAEIFRTMCENMRTEEINLYDAYSTDNVVDIFNDVIIQGYKDAVERVCDVEICKDVLQGMKLEYETRCDIKLAQCGDNEEKKMALRKRRANTSEIVNYIQKLLNKGRNLASPGISKNDFDEERSVDAIAYSEKLQDFAGIEIASLLDAKNAAGSISIFELHFFRSIYGLTPVQLSKLCSPAMDKDELAKCVDIGSIDSSVEVGDYFVAYQEYMENIGPDCKLNALITPHIDKSWNSISVMPELDLDYQCHLMQNIHQAFFYGFLFDVIQRYQPSTRYDPKTVVYRYYDEHNDPKNFTVSNGTLCDRFYEVLDSLYFDRAAVTSIKKIAHAKRAEDKRSRTTFDDGIFGKALKNLSRVKMMGQIPGEDAKLAETTPTSVFELPIMYYNSLRVSEDIDEIRAMTEAIINAIEYQLSAKEKAADVKAHLAVILVEHFNLLLKNYHTFQNFLADGVEVRSNNAMVAIYKCVKDHVDAILQNGHDLYDLDHTFGSAKK